MNNIERFDAYTLYIFGALYLAFPLARRLDNVAIVNAVGLPVKKGEENLETALVQNTIDWLRETGFLNYRDPSDTRDPMQYRYVLAPRAFEALRRGLPESIKEGGEKGKPKSLGEKAIEYGKHLGILVSTEGGKQVVSRLVTLGIDWMAGKGN